MQTVAPPIRAAEKNRIATNDFANDIANISIQKYNNIVHNNNNNSNELNFQQTVLSTFVLRYKNPTNNQYTLTSCCIRCWYKVFVKK